MRWRWLGFKDAGSVDVGAHGRSIASRALDERNPLKLKMAENSLFAILLRSPWWASLGIAVALALLMRLLLPADYAVAGMLGSFPFVVIAAIAAWKQLRAPSASQLAQTLERLQAMNSREFADAIEAAFRAQGHEVTRLNQPGADLELMLRHRRTVVAFKRWKAASIGVEPLRELRAACERLQAAAGIYVHGGVPSDKALDYARQNQLRLMPVTELAQQLLAGGALRG
jgi:restriction system protein